MRVRIQHNVVRRSRASHAGRGTWAPAFGNRSQHAGLYPGVLLPEHLPEEGGVLVLVVEVVGAHLGDGGVGGGGGEPAEGGGLDGVRGGGLPPALGGAGLGEVGAELALLLVELEHDADPDHAGEDAGDDLADEHDGEEPDDAHDEEVLLAPGPELEGVQPAHRQALEGDGADGELEDVGGAEGEQRVGVEQGGAQEHVGAGDEGGDPVAGERELVLDQQEEGQEAPQHVEHDVAGRVDIGGGRPLAVDHEAEQHARHRQVGVQAGAAAAPGPPALPLRGEDDPVDEEQRAHEVVHPDAAEPQPAREGDEPQHRYGLHDGEEGRDVRLHHPQVHQLPLVHALFGLVHPRRP
eukprot:764770-Hanusia_phi.AAC.2